MKELEYSIQNSNFKKKSSLSQKLIYVSSKYIYIYIGFQDHTCS